jgi:hypothetical protein
MRALQRPSTHILPEHEKKRTSDQFAVPLVRACVAYSRSAFSFRNSLLSKINSLLRFSEFPVLLLREFCRKSPSQRAFFKYEWVQSCPSSSFSLYFSLLAGNLKTEPGSIVTESATNHSPHGGDFPERP